jgi:hypothetical protein
VSSSPASTKVIGAVTSYRSNLADSAPSQTPALPLWPGRQRSQPHPLSALTDDLPSSARTT